MTNTAGANPSRTCEIVNKSLGKKIKMLRENSGITQEQLSERVNLSQNFISQLENGKKSPSIDTLCNIADILEAPVSVFFEDVDPSDTSGTKEDHYYRQITFLIKSMAGFEKAFLVDFLKLYRKKRR